MLISVVVPFHNAERYIRACAEALLAANYPRDRYEIIMVDNNSTDRSAGIVREFPQVRLLSESRPGSYAARNRGAADARGTVIAFTDSDCAPSADWLERIASAMSDPQVVLVQGSQRFARESLVLSVLSDYEAEKAAYVFASQVPEIYYGYTNNMAVRRDVFEQIGPFMELERGADVIFVQRTIDKYSCDVIHYRADVCGRHLEMTSALTWFRKTHIYGRSSRRYNTFCKSRPLRFRERLKVLRATVGHGRYSVAKSMVLTMLLGVGGVCYQVGRYRR